jgi:hypothetical protein
LGRKKGSINFGVRVEDKGSLKEIKGFNVQGSYMDARNPGPEPRLKRMAGFIGTSRSN